jgi:hypothetical protein
MLAASLLKLHSFVFACTIGGGDFFGFPHWWKYLNGEVDPIGKCVPAFSGPSDLLPIGLAIIDMLLHLAGIVAVISIVIAGISYITAGGSPEQITNARKRITYSLVGLVIAVTAAALVSFIGKNI